MKKILVLALAIVLGSIGPAFGADKAKPTDTSSTAAQSAPAGEKLDLNTATEQELAQLTGIGEARSKAIVKGRPYRAKNELVDRKILPQGVYDKIKDQIIAKQGK